MPKGVMVSYPVARERADTARFYAKVTLRWIRTAKAAGYVFGGEDGLPSLADIDHSALLERLALGHDPLPVPPPRDHGYPWYGLVETGEATLPAFVVHPLPLDFLGRRGFLICQSPWAVVGDVDAETYAVEYHKPERAPGTWHLQRQPNGDWRLWRVEDPR